MSDLPAKVALHGQCHTVTWLEAKQKCRVAKLRSPYTFDRHWMTREEVLALPTWEDFKAQRDAQVSKAPRGHCQICERSIGIKAGVIAHHGYERPGYGYQTASCHGARELPYEKSNAAIQPVIDTLRAMRGDRLHSIATLEAPDYSADFKVETFRGKTKTVTRDAHPFEWERTRQARVAMLKTEVRHLDHDIDRLTKRRDNWKEIK